MALAPGTRLGPYAITASIGAGGMGEVYKATDTRLDRTVAIKVLPEHVASDLDLKQRFEREAKTLAALSHPHICNIHDVGSQVGIDFLVMEYLEGETLEQRLKKGALPLDQALQIGIQIADALAAAHRTGIVHRDLKPGNVMLTKSGVKLLDFGLAKTGAPAVAGSLSMLPTTPPNLTAQGTILGTFQYMAPEQLEGQEADARTDIFAFGVVLYEMVTGKKAFEGKSQASLIAAILEREPPAMSTVQPLAPPALDRVVKKCLAKEPEKRWHSAHDLHDDLQWLADSEWQVGVVSPIAAVRQPAGWRRTLVPAVILLVSLAAASLPFAVVHLLESAPDDRSIRFVVLGPETSFVTGTPPVISPDGRRLAFVASAAGKTQLWVRSIDSTTAQPLAGTEDADYPFWSPDSRSIAFFAGGRLKKIDASGGPAQTLCTATLGRGGAWNRDGVIVFGPSASEPLYRVSSAGGTPTPVTELGALGGELNHRAPSFLPDGNHFLFFVQGEGDRQGIYVGSLQSKDRKLLLLGNSSGIYAPPGYVLFVRERTLMAQRLDVTNLELVGDPSPIAEPVGFYNAVTATMSVSDNGVLAYTSGIGAERQLAWFNRVGMLVERIGSTAPILDLVLSPDQKRVAVQWANNDIRVVDLERGGVPSALTFGPSVEDWPVWSPNGDRILFSSTSSGVDLHWKPSSGAGNEEVVVKSGTAKRPTDWSSDGRFILFENDDPKNRTDLLVFPLFGERKPQPVLQGPFSEFSGRFSPDAKLIAYGSDESGTPEVYVQTFPPTGGKWKVSTSGGVAPRWRRDGKELFYLSPDRKIMSVEVTATNPALEYRTATALFEAPLDIVTPAAGNRYDVSKDGQRFLIGAPVQASTAPITVVINWTAELRK